MHANYASQSAGGINLYRINFYRAIPSWHVTIHDIILECITLSRGIHITVVGKGVAIPFHPPAS